LKVNLQSIVFEITSDCNLNCRYCYNIWKRPNNKQVSFNSYKNAKKTLKRLFKISDVNQIVMSGGEPFLGERFSELALYCRMNHKNVIIISNGNIGTKQDYSQLVKMGVTLFELPIHSYNSISHDYLTQVSGSWNKTVQSVKSLIELNANVVGVIVLTKVNHSEVEETLLFINKLGIKHVMLNRFNIGGKGISEQKNLLLNHKELQNAFRIANSYGKKLGLKISSNVCTPFCVIDPEDYNNIKMSSCAANVVNMPLTLDITGNMRLCNHSPVIIGNIFKNTLKDMLNSEYVKSWKDIVPDYCIDCEKYSKCLGGCRAASEQLGLTLKNVDPVVFS